MLTDIFSVDKFIQQPGSPAPEGIRLLLLRGHATVQNRKPPFSCKGSVATDWLNNYLRQSETLIPPALIEVINAEVRGHGLVSSQEGNLLMGRAICTTNSLPEITPWSCGKPLGLLFSSRPENLVKVDAPLVLLMRPGDHIYGHWLVDILPKLLLAATYRDKGWRYLLANSTPSYAFELLSAFDIGREQCILVDPNTQVVYARQLIVSGALRQGNFVWPDACECFKRLRAYFYDSNIPSSPQIYLKRPPQDQKRRLLNRPRIEGVFEANGFQSIAPEKLTFREQFSLLTNASVIAAETGSALHGSVVAEKAKVLELRSNADGSFIQAGLCEICDQEIGYFIGEAIARPGIGREASWIVNSGLLDGFLRNISSVCLSSNGKTEALSDQPIP